MYEGILWSEFASFCVSPTNCPCCFVYIPTKCALSEMVQLAYAVLCTNATADLLKWSTLMETVHLAYTVLCTNAANRVLTEMVHFTYTVMCANATMDLQRRSTLPLQFCVPVHTNNKPCVHLCQRIQITNHVCTYWDAPHCPYLCTNATNNVCIYWDGPHCPLLFVHQCTHLLRGSTSPLLVLYQCDKQYMHSLRWSTLPLGWMA